jgi:hypothetical protein
MVQPRYSLIDMLVLHHKSLADMYAYFVSHAANVMQI